MGQFRFTWLDFVLSSVSLVLFLVDVVLDLLAACSFYWAGAWGRLGVLALLLGGSSVLVQVYSWLWYGYDDYVMRTRVEESVRGRTLGVLHLLQLGSYLRYLGVLETAMKSIRKKGGDPEDDPKGGDPKGGDPEDDPKGGDPEDDAAYLSHDLNMLRIMETFSESAPQLVLMLTSVLQGGRLHPIPVLKAAASASAVAFCVTTYHRSLRSFLPEKHRPSLVSSLVFFLWNLLLIASRVAALALFASVLPCFVFAHFLCCWALFFFCAWRAQTHFMDSAGGEWLYRGTVGLIWYFSWFNVSEGRTRHQTLLYHGFALADTAALCGVWFWRTTVDPPYVPVLPPGAATAACLVVLYVLGLALKLLYYKYFHPNVGKEELEGDGGMGVDDARGDGAETPGSADEVDLPMYRCLRAPHPQIPPTSERCNRRMRKLAENFYS